MQVDSDKRNHVGIITEEGELLHHLYGQPSALPRYARGYFKDRTMICVRHKDLPQEIKPWRVNHYSSVWRTGRPVRACTNWQCRHLPKRLKALCINFDGLEDYLMNAKKNGMTFAVFRGKRT
ncbi:hypothetical protein ACVXG7_09265 [Enterobacter hormaechei]